MTTRWRTAHRSLLVGIILIGLPAAVVARVAVEDVEIGVGGLVRSVGWVRFAVTLSAEGDPFTGTATVSFGGGEVARTATIPASGRIRWEDVAYAPPLTVEGALRLEGMGGSDARFALPFSPTLTANDVGVLAIAKTRGTVAFLADRPVEGRLGPDDPRNGRFVIGETGALGSLPTEWAGWSGVDLLIWTGIDPRSRAFSARQKRALVQWLLRGGTLVAVDDGLMEGWGGSFLAPLLPYAPSRREEIRLWGATRSVYWGELRPQAWGIEAEGGARIGAARDVGLGRALFVGIAPASLDEEAEAALWARVLHEVRSPPLRTWDVSARSARARLIARLEPPKSGPASLSIKTRRLALGGAGWIVVLIMFAVWHRVRRPRYGWVVVLLAVVVASVVPPVLRSRTRIVAPREWGVLRVFPSEREGYWQGVLAIPPMEERQVRVPFSAATHPFALEEGAKARWVGRSLSGKPGGELVAVHPDPHRSRFWQGQAFVPFVGRVRAVRGGEPGTFRVMNETTLRFARGAILQGNRASVIDGFAAGASARVVLREIPRRRLFWSSLNVPAPVFGFWAREGMLEALVPGDGVYFLGWTRGIAAVGTERGAPSQNVLLVIVPLDIREGPLRERETSGERG